MTTKVAPRAESVQTYGYVVDVPVHAASPGIGDIAAVLAHWEAAGIRPVQLGAGVTLLASAGDSPQTGPFARPPNDLDAYLVRHWASLILAALGGPAVACATSGCIRDAAVMLTGGVAVCHEHYAAPVEV